MILSKQPLTIAEAKEIVEELDEKQDLKDYFKRFTKMKIEKAKELKKEIESLENMKIKKEDVVKIVDFLPDDKEDLAKIFSDISLDEEEIKTILEIVKKYGAK